MSKLDLTEEFKGRRALITGGSRGIGAAVAQRLLDGGAQVVVAARSRHEQTPVGATFIAADISTGDGVKRLVEAAVAALGGLDILVNSAGAARVHLPNSEAISDAEWIDSLNVNFLSALRVTYAALPALRKSEAAAIVNISTGGAIPFIGPLMHYGAAKSALDNWSQALAKELAHEKIRVNVVTPGIVVTPGGDEVRDTLIKAFGITTEDFFKGIPLGRPGQPEDIEEMIAFLVSDRASWITGHKHYVSGGGGELV